MEIFLLIVTWLIVGFVIASVVGAASALGKASSARHARIPVRAVVDTFVLLDAGPGLERRRMRRKSLRA